MIFPYFDCSQFGDIYREDYFIKILKNEVDIVKELPPHLKSLDMEAIGSLVCISQVHYCENTVSWARANSEHSYLLPRLLMLIFLKRQLLVNI